MHYIMQHSICIKWTQNYDTIQATINWENKRHVHVKLDHINGYINNLFQRSQQDKVKFQDQLFTKFQDNFRTFFDTAAKYT